MDKRISKYIHLTRIEKMVIKAFIALAAIGGIILLIGMIIASQAGNVIPNILQPSIKEAQQSQQQSTQK